MKDYERLRMLEYPQGVVDIVIDTDAATEVDDPFAIAYALLSPERLNIRAVFAAPFAMNERASNPKDGMEMSYAEIMRLLELTHIENRSIVFRGSERFLADEGKPVRSEAAYRLIELAEEYTREKPLYIVAIGAITNIASAVLLCPDIINRIVLVWLGGNDFDESPNVYNIYQDVKSAQVIFDSGIPLVHVPCNYVASHMLTGIPELNNCIMGKNKLCDYLIRIMKEYGSNHFAWGKQLWDIAAIGYLINEAWSRVETVSAPILTDNITWSRDYTRHLIKNIRQLDRDKIFRDMYVKLGSVKD